MKARLLVCLTGVGLICASGRVISSPWSTEPLVGVAAEYTTNPELLSPATPQSEAHAALLADLPLNYDQDSLHLSVLPRVRYSDTRGYSSVTSNYYHLDSSAQWLNDLGSLTFAASEYRDSSLLYAAEVENGIGVRRDTFSENVEWQHALTERLQFQSDASSSRTLFGRFSGPTDLVDYRYSIFSPALVYALSERDKLRLVGSVSRYNSLNDVSSSDTSDMQLGLEHRVSELWSLSLLTGYSKSTDRYHYFFGTLSKAQKGAVYSATLTRSAENLTFAAGIGRALTPTGFAFLSRQDSVNASFSYNRTERWKIGGEAQWARISDPMITGGTIEHRFYNASLSVDWRCTEHWRGVLRLGKVGQRFSESVAPTSSMVSVEVLRQFYRTNAQ